MKALKCIKNDDKEDGGIGPRKKRKERRSCRGECTVKSIMIKAMSSLNPAGSPSQGIKRCSFVKVASMSDTVLFAVAAMMHKFKQY